MSELPQPPSLYDVWKITPTTEQRLLRDVVEWSLMGPLWFFTKADRSVTVISLQDLGEDLVQVRPV